MQQSFDPKIIDAGKRPWGWKIITYTYVKDSELSHIKTHIDDPEGQIDAIKEKAEFQGMHMQPVWDKPEDQIAS